MKSLSRLFAVAVLAAVAALCGMVWAVNTHTTANRCAVGTMRFTGQGGVQICAPR